MKRNLLIIAIILLVLHGSAQTRRIYFSISGFTGNSGAPDSKNVQGDPSFTLIKSNVIKTYSGEIQSADGTVEQKYIFPGGYGVDLSYRANSNSRNESWSFGFGVQQHFQLAGFTCPKFKFYGTDYSSFYHLMKFNGASFFVKHTWETVYLQLKGTYTFNYLQYMNGWESMKEGNTYSFVQNDTGFTFHNKQANSSNIFIMPEFGFDIMGGHILELALSYNFSINNPVLVSEMTYIKNKNVESVQEFTFKQSALQLILRLNIPTFKWKKPVPPPPPAPDCYYTYSEWGPCINNYKTRTVTKYPYNCVGTPDNLTKPCDVTDVENSRLQKVKSLIQK